MKNNIKFIHRNLELMLKRVEHYMLSVSMLSVSMLTNAKTTNYTY